MGRLIVVARSHLPNPKYHTVTRPFIVIIFLFIWNASFGQDQFCNDPAYRQRAFDFGKEFIEAFSLLGKFKGADSVSVILQRLKHDFPSNYEKVMNASRELRNLNSNEEDLFICFLNTLPDDYDYYGFREWVTHFRGLLMSDDFLSPEFAKGWTFYSGLGQGAADLLRSDESYSVSLRALFGYTFAREESGGHIRLLMGLSSYYQDNNLDLFLNPRAEVRLSDIAVSLTSIGTKKLIVEGNVNKDVFIGGAGFGVEIGPVNIDLLGEYQTGYKHWSFQFSVGYIHTNPKGKK